jgi:hypothetical protein
MTDVRLVTANDEQKLKKFYKNAYGENHILNNSSHSDWQFLKNPFNILSTKSIIIAENNNEIVAHMGIIPVPVKIYDNIVSGAWHASYFTLKKFRGIGIGTKMVQLSNSLFHCIGGMGNSDASNKIHIKNGGKNFRDINRYIKILDKTSIENFIQKQVEVIIKKENITKSEGFFRISVLDINYDKFWKIIKDRFPITINRTKEYLTWRYLQHPLIDYHFMVLIKDQKIFGYSILRFEDNNKELKAGRIVDFVSFEQYETELLQNTQNYFENKVDFIDFFCSNSIYKHTFEKEGFFNNSLMNYSIPTVFNPINRDRNSINLHFKINSFPTTNTKYYNGENLFFTKADADQDRAF